jgi:hypothetical protein
VTIRDARRTRRLVTSAAATVSILSLGLAAAASASTSPRAASRAATQHWRIVARTNSAWTTVIAPSAASGWVLGIAGKIGSSVFTPAGLHWNGRKWSAVPFPKSVASGIGCAGVSSPGNVWAFAGASPFGYGANYAGALHLVRGKWLVAKTFTPPGLVSGCSVLGRGNAWVYGLTHVAPGAGTWRLAGRTWKPVRHTGNFDLVTGSTVSAKDVWAIAAGPSGLNNVVAHWNGRSWTANKALGAVLPKPSATVTPTITAINAVGAGDVWISAEIAKLKNGIFTTTVIVLHLTRRTWHKVGPGSFGFHLPAAVSDGHGGWWAPGPPLPGPPVPPVPPSLVPVRSPYLLHGTGGHWHRVALPTVSGAVLLITGIVHVPGTRAMLAIAQLQSNIPVLRSVVLAYGQLPK